MADFLIRPYSPADSIPAITALLHDAYGSLARQGFRFLATHQDDAITLSRLTSGDAFIAESAGQIIGTIFVYPPWPDSPCELYRQPGVFRLGQLAVAPPLQSRGIGRALMEYGEQHARSRGAIELAMDTAEGAAHLLDWYQRLGSGTLATCSGTTRITAARCCRRRWRRIATPRQVVSVVRIWAAVIEDE